MKRLGLIAGNGKFPILVAESARDKDIDIIAIAFKEETSRRLESLVDRIYWIGIGELSKLFKIFENEDIKEAIMAGQIKPIHLFKPWIRKDATMRTFLNKARDRRGDSLLKSIADELDRRGVKLLDSSFLLTSSLAQKGILTKSSIDKKDWQDIEFGRDIAKKLASLSIGQTVIVKDKAVVAVEAIEGTDATIRRGFQLAKEGCIVVKVSRQKHDMRFDIPVVGLKTLKVLKECRVKVLAIEAQKTLLIDKNKFLKGANKLGISVVGI